MAFGNELAGGFSEIVGEVLADHPDGAPAHLIEAFLLRTAEQFALGGGAFDVQTARGHEGLTAHRPVGEEEHRRLGNLRFRGHLAEMKLGQHAAAHLLRLGGDPLTG